MNSENPVKTFSHRGWDVRIYLTMVTPEICTGHVEILEGSTLKCRISLAGQMDEASAIQSLELKSADWVADWMNRAHSGNTGFSEL